MSMISQERLNEMEAEMDRFEQEIQAGEDLPKVIIGSNTYSQVSAQLKMLRGASGITPEQRERKHQEVAAQLKLLRARAERESSPPAEFEDLDCDRSRIIGMDDPPPSSNKLPIDASYLAPPPPPPPALGASSTSFVPHQLKHRPPPPQNRPPGPPRMRPPPRFGGPMGPGGMMYGPGPGGMHPGQGPGAGGPFPGPRFGGPMGPGPMGPGPGPMMGPGPMGPGPLGPGPMGGPRPHEMMGGGMYGVSSGEEHKETERKKSKPEEVDEGPKVIYSSAPVITVQKPKKKKKKKKEEKEERMSSSAEQKLDSHLSKFERTESEMFSAAPTVSTVTRPEVVDDFSVADMEIEEQVNAPLSRKEKKEKKKKYVRMAAGQTWEDPSLIEWDTDDFRLFCGDLGNEVSDEVLSRAFNKYPSFIKARVVRDKRSNKTRGYGFVSFREPTDYARAMREMNGKYVGNRPIKLRKSTWKDRNKDIVIRKEKEKKKLGLK